MSAEAYVVDKILSDAHEKANFLIADAKKRAADKLRTAKIEAEKQQETDLIKARNNIKDLKSRSLQLVTVEQRKTDLAAKHKILDAVFSEARTEVLTAKNYKEFIKSLIIKYCNCDSCIVVSKRDEKALSAEFIKSCGTKLKYKLTRHVDSSFEGGIIIECSKYDINLTLDVLLESAHKQLEVEVAQILWG